MCDSSHVKHAGRFKTGELPLAQRVSLHGLLQTGHYLSARGGGEAGAILFALSPCVRLRHGYSTGSVAPLGFVGLSITGGGRWCDSAVPRLQLHAQLLRFGWIERIEWQVETGGVSLYDKQNREDEMHNRNFSQILGFDKRSAASLSPCSSSSSCVRRPLHNRLATLKRHKGAVKASSPVFRSRPRAEWLGLYPSISGRNKETICCRSCLNKLFDKETIYIMKKLLRVPPRWMAIVLISSTCRAGRSGSGLWGISFDFFE